MDRASTLAAVLRRMDPQARLIDVRELPGGMSAQITALEAEFPDGPRTVVVRQYGVKNVAADPHPGTTETMLLRSLRSAGLSVPRPLFADDGTDLLGGPYCVVEFVAADGPPAEWSARTADQFVAVLTRLHRLPTEPVESVLRPYAARVDRWLARQPDRPDESMRESRIRAALSARWPRRHELGPCILHGDFWPGNTMWQHDRLQSVIDWEDAAIGDPRSDLANLRLELTWAYGQDAAEDATARYIDAVRAADNHPAAAELAPSELAPSELAPSELAPSELALWDLAAATRPVGRLAEWGLDPQRLDDFLARYQGFVDRALDRLSA